MISVSELLLAAFFVVWTVLTVIRQFNVQRPWRLTSWDQTGVIPVYRFFAPFPGRYDYHLLVRYGDSANLFSNWVELGPYTERGSLSFVLNPEKRVRKAYLDIVTELAHELERNDGEVSRVNLSYPYLTLLMACEEFLKANYAVESGSTRYQFFVLASSGYEKRDMEPLILSSIHTVG